MVGKITAIINTYNEEKNIERVIKSLDFVDEIIVCDMYSDDDTAVIAKKLGAKIILHKNEGYVEPARNFAISKAAHEWILVVDADEEVQGSLANYLKEVVQKQVVSTYIEIPRKNIIFGKWMKASMWWPDYNVRFFKKGSVEWSDQIHKKPKTAGQGVKLPGDEKWAIVHNHYQSVFEFVNRMNRYTDIQAKELKQRGYEFSWQDLISKPLNEFLSRFFANRGFEDGLHGLALSLLQAFSFLVLYLKLWEDKKFNEQKISLEELRSEAKKAQIEINYWFKYGNLSKNPLARFLQRAKNKIS
ncbi:glycosyltransferase family 2 protein [Candidatus Daviesbacteria bacterium]|nr:glycosyltransferase family 2 protein [Candidatus Daviesbacteria bacterium]